MNAREQVSPEDLISQSELICEKLLGWTKMRPTSPLAGIEYVGWRRPTGGEQLSTPSFTTWAETGLILDALQRLSYDRRTAADVLVMLGDRLIGALLTPADIRAAALDYLKQTMGWHTYLKAVKS